jgi:hypothetical protein
VWAPQGGEDAAAIDVTFPHRGALTYLGFVVSRGGGPDAHVLRQAGIARRVIEKMELEYGGRTAVTFNQALLMWTIHGRVHLEWPAAVLPPPLLRPNGQPGWDATMAYEQKQHRALAAILGRSAGGAPSHQTILAVFGLWRIDERRVVARARYAFVFSQTQRRPWRKSIFAELQARVGRDPNFRKQSVTGAIDAALQKLGLAWPGAAAVDSDDEDFVRLLRSRADAAQQHPHRRLALMLGRARGIELPWALASALPGAFVRTWGRWSARALQVTADAGATVSG